MATEWKALAGTGGQPIDIEPYNSSGDGLAYVLKLADRADCHWDFSNNLSLFFRESVDLSTSQGRRRYNRHLARASSSRMKRSGNAADTLGLSWDGSNCCKLHPVESDLSDNATSLLS